MRKGSKIVLTRRDYNILRFLFEQKVASQSSIFAKFFINKTKSACVMRLQKLVKNNYLNKNGVNLNGKLEISYSLTNHGFLKIKDELSLNGIQLKLKSDSIIHDIELSKIRVVLESFKMVDSYFSENLIQSCILGENTPHLVPYRKINSDAALKIKVPEGSFFVSLEYERSIKNKNRYAKKFLDYYLDNSITAVLYICANKQLQNTIIKIDKEVSNNFKSKIFTLELNDLHFDIKNMPFINNQKASFNLK